MIASGTKMVSSARRIVSSGGGRWREKGLLRESLAFFRRRRSMRALACATGRNETGAVPMPSNLSLPELDDRIAVLRDNIRQLVEQGAGASGGQNEERTADRIAQQTAELDKLVAEREGLARK
jgi:uncharacterized small protein (DUF1192 family)